MSTTKLNIGKIPISKGEYHEGTTYQRLNQVTMLGSTYQSKIDDNTSAPAQMGADGAVENINTDKWLCVAVGNVSAARKVVYNNETSGLEAGNVQKAIDELANKKFDKESIVQESGEAEDKVMSQKAVSDKLSDLSKKIDNTDADVRGFFNIENVFLLTTNKWRNSPSYKSTFYPINSPKAKVKVVAKDNNCIIAFLKSNSHNTDTDADYSTGTSRIVVDKNTELETIIPADAEYIYISVESKGISFYPAHVFVNDIDILSSFIEKLANIKRTIIVGKDEDYDYTSITKAINEAYLINVRNIVVKAGIYDIISEYQEEYGETFFKNYSEKNTNKGIVLKNGINILFSGNSKVICKYTGGNEKVTSRFSPFNSGEGGFTVDGLNIESANVRYCFHDERLQSEDSYFNTYRNCRFKQDNTQSNQTFRACIGGGLGKNGHVVVDSCEFESVGLTEPRGICTYHNTTADSGRSFVFVKNCYFHGFGSTYIHYAGTSSDITTMFVSGCSFEKSLPLPVKAEGSYTVENVELIEFNNSIVGKEYLPKEEYAKDKDEMLAEISKKQDMLNQVSTEYVTEDDNFVAIKKDDGTDVVTVCDEGVTVSGNLVVDGKNVLNEVSDKQGKLIEGDNITIDNNGKISALSKNIEEKTVDAESIGEDEQIFSNNDETEEYVKIGKYGIKAKDYFDINGNPIKTYSNDTYFEKEKISPISLIPSVVYEGDSKSSSINYIVNAVMYPNGVIIAARANATIVKINLDGTESTLLTLTGEKTDWRGLFMDSSLNVYASPHASLGSLNMTDRGLYKLSYGESSFKKVISLYNTSSSDAYETQENDDTIWTMCEDADGYLYAGVYCHSKRYAARIYRSTDKGETWIDYYDFKQILPTGHHVHCITYNPYNNSLYAIIGEINTIIKSTDHGTTWTNLNARCEGDKGTAMIATPTGMVIGSDGAYELTMSKLLADDKTVVTCGRVWANTCFGTRRSDVTGWIYAFGKIDSSVNSLMYMPPLEAITDSSILENWKNGTYSSMESKPPMLPQWQSYHDKVKSIYPEDCIRPQHFAILVSKDDGNTWEVAYRERVLSTAANGIWCVGTFRNGECVCGRFVNRQPQKPLIVSDGKHCYNENGIMNELFNKIK